MNKLGVFLMVGMSVIGAVTCRADVTREGLTPVNMSQ